jgi:N-methylhydantoinase B
LTEAVHYNDVMQHETRTFDPIQVGVWGHLLASIAEEMGATLERTAYSPNIKERLDHSCALFDNEGRLLAQAAHIPVHLGAMPAMMQALLRHPTARWSPGIMWLCNDPRVGGTHLPDLTLIAPVYAPASSLSGKRVRIGFVASRAHHADIGGLSPGSLPLSTELFHEGLVLPPVALVERGKVREEIVRLVCANSRTPEERRGDLAAQIAANETGIRRMQALYGRTAGDAFALRARENLDYAERMVRRALAQLPAGTYHAEDVLDGTPNDALPLPIQVAMTVRSEGSITFDFTGSAPQTAFSLNATEAITRSACYYVVRCLVEDDIPTNEGCFRPVEVIAPEGSIVHARFPAAVAAGNVETSQRIVDVLLKALAQAAPERAPAASQGTMNNLTLGGFDPVRQRSFAYYETIAGGIGASAQGAGASAMHAHMTNTRNTPVEALETHYPLRVREYALAEGTGGQGEHPGGNGLIRRIELLAEAQVSFLGERRRFAPFGAAGGGAGASGSETLQLPGQAPETLFGKWSRFCPARTLVTIRTPGGGGWGGSG